MTTRKENYLVPIFEDVKSYYEKAKIIQEDKNIYLYSYNNKVLTMDKNTKIIKLEPNRKLYTKTTVRHVKEFLKQFTSYYDDYTKKELFNIFGI